MARLQEEDVYRLDIENSLNDFILSYSYTLPQRVKVIEGFYDTEGSDCEFSNGDVIILHNIVCPTVTLSYCDPSSGIDFKTSVPVSHPTKFHCQPYTGVLEHTQKEKVYHTVKEMVEMWPLVVKASKDFRMTETVKFAAKDRLTLIRLVTRHGLCYLECKHHKTQKVMQLPMGCEGDFIAVKDKKLYTLEEIVYNQPPRKRLLKVAEDPYSRGTVPLPGVPDGFKGELFMQAPSMMAELYPCDCPGDIVAVPITTPIMVSPREDTYTGAVRMEYPLDYYIEKNPSHLPGLITVTSWEEMTTICDNLGIRPGVQVHLHKVVAVPKVLAIGTNGRYFAIPLNYGRNIRLLPAEYQDIEEVFSNSQLIKVKVTKKSSPVTYKNLHALKVGDVIRPVLGSRKPCHVGPSAYDEIEVLSLELLDPHSHKVIKEIKVPSYLDGSYEELFTPDQKELRRLDRVGTMEFPLQVQFSDSGDPVVDPTLDPIPTHKNMLLTHIIEEPCVVASKKANYARSFHLPLRTELMLTFEEKLSDRAKIPSLSVLDSFGEEISEPVYHKLAAFISSDYNTYEAFNETPPSRPLPCPLNHTTSWSRRHATVPKPPKIPPSTAAKPTVSRSSSTPGERPNPYDSLGYVRPIGFRFMTSRQSREPKTDTQGSKVNEQDVESSRVDHGPPPPLPARKGSLNQPTQDAHTRRLPRKEPCDHSQTYGSDGEDVYEIIKDYDRLKGDLFGEAIPPIVEIPDDGNVSTFSHHEMLVFLQLLNISTTAAKHFSTTKVDGKDFANFSNEELEKYGIKTPMTIHFRDRSKKALNLTFTVL